MKTEASNELAHESAEELLEDPLVPEAQLTKEPNQQYFFNY